MLSIWTTQRFCFLNKSEHQFRQLFSLQKDNYLPNNKILDQCKLKALADDKLALGTLNKPIAHFCCRNSTQMIAA